MEEIRKLVVVVAGYGVAMAIGVLVMVYGWGLHPQSWGWIIGGGVAVPVIARLAIACAK